MIESLSLEDILITPPKETGKLAIGIDIGKLSHAAGFVSKSLLDRHKRFGACPAIEFQNSRAGFELLLKAMQARVPLDQCIVLLEKTGHYGFALEQFLQQQGIAVYKIHIQRRPSKRKTDKRDALGLANKLYNQMVLGAQAGDSSEICRLIPPTSTATKLRTLVQRRHELTRDITMRKNKLTAICDELFPELNTILKNPNGPTALVIRSRFPTAAAVATAKTNDLVACRTRGRPSAADLAKLQKLAEQSIANRDPARLHSLRIEQAQLIEELQLLQRHMTLLEDEITSIVTESREGKILCSLPAISPIQAAILIGFIGSIGNFSRASRLRGYCGWAPKEEQSGSTLDSVKLDDGGNRLLKQTVYLIAWTAVGHDTEFRIIYDRLVPIKCRLDERTDTYRGKNKVMGRICGQIIGIVYVLLRQDYDLLASLPEGVGNLTEWLKVFAPKD